MSNSFDEHDAHEDDLSLGARSRRPCRACTDFRTWAKLKSLNKKIEGQSAATSRMDDNDKSKEFDTGTKNMEVSEKHVAGQDCPLDIEELGNNTWSFLHTMAAYFPDQPTQTQQNEMKQFIATFSKFYPCDHCASDFRERLRIHPPEVATRSLLSQWLCEEHNVVNRKLNKKEFNCKLVDERWRDGWSDGSCD